MTSSFMTHSLNILVKPLLGKYPLHWHNCFNIGPDVYEDPSAFEYNSIHHAFSRFITVHGTDHAQVIGNAGYLTRGHGYFLEDGIETFTNFTGNLGMVTHQGIILPTDKGTALCNDAREGGIGGGEAQGECNGLSMFWISNINTYLNDNFALGGKVCYWISPHNNAPGQEMDLVQSSCIQSDLVYPIKDSNQSGKAARCLVS